MLGELIACLRGYLHLETIDHVLFALAVAVASLIDRGDPLWGLIIGPPSSGKTEVIRMLDRVAHEHPDEITGPSLLSWSKTKPPKAVGILSRLPDPALLTVGDFSTVLAMSDHGGKEALFALLRRVYDGSVSRDLGNSERALTWQGRLTFLAACTPAIDRASSHDAALGPRWVYLRVPEQDSETKRATGRMALGAGQLAQYRTQAATLAERIVKSAAGQVPDELDLTVEVSLVEAAIVGCFGRGSVERSGYGRREITSVATVEEPPRLTGQLALLARSLLALGLDVDDALALCRRCALDSVPQPRRACLAVLATVAPTSAASVSEIARSAGIRSRDVTRHALEELEAIGVAATEDPELTEKGSPHHWTLCGPDEDLIRRVMLDDADPKGVLRKLGTHPPSPQDGGTDRGASYFSQQLSDLVITDELIDSWAGDDPEPLLTEEDATARLLAAFPGASEVA